MTTGSPHPLLRARDGHHARVTFEELFFDLVYVFAVTQLSHTLLHHLTPAGALETMVLWFAVWLGWQYTCWVTNWFDPTAPAIRSLLFITMFLGLIMAASLPQAFGDRGWVFAGAYVAMQVGRTAFIVWQLPARHPLAPNFRRMLGWILISSCFWIAGGLADHHTRLILWACAIACEYVSPMFGFALPGMGRSQTRDWSVEGGHLAERCQLFVIVALGESLLASGVTLANVPVWHSALFGALLVTFVATLAMWWLYFGTASRDATAVITRSTDPGRLGAYFHYIHAVLAAGIIVSAVGTGLVMANAHESPTLMQLMVLSAGPVIYLLGSAVYKRIVYAAVPRSHLTGSLVILTVAMLSHGQPMLLLFSLNTAILLAVAFWEVYACRREVVSHG